MYLPRCARDGHDRQSIAQREHRKGAVLSLRSDTQATRDGMAIAQSIRTSMAKRTRTVAPTSDRSVMTQIQRLVEEEQTLYGHEALSTDDVARLEAVKVELDQCWDLLRQRRAKREFGDDPDKAKVRPASVVENYEQ